MSWKPEVQTNDESWTGNALRFETKEEAEAYVRELYARWTSVRDTRVVESNDPVNYRWEDGRAYPLEKDDAKSPRPSST